METVFKRPESLKDTGFRYCPGCGHSILHRIVAECIDRLGIREDVIGIAPVGCAVFAYDYLDIDMVEAAHGRPPAVATGLKRMLPDKIIFSYQGDGDMVSIGMAEIIHAASRSENITVIFVNNATYGMTGGQMAPTTLLGQKTTTTQTGRKKEEHGYPIRVSELIATLDGAIYVARGTLSSAQNIKKVKRYIMNAFVNQINKRGFSFVEVLSPCPTDWGMKPLDAIKWLRDSMETYFAPQVLKDLTREIV